MAEKSISLTNLTAYNDKIKANYQTITDTDLKTTDKTVTGAINENTNKIDILNTTVTNHIANHPSGSGTWDGILTSENGTKYKVIVSNDGTLSTQAVVVYGQIVISKTSVTISEGQTGTFTVALDKAPTSNQIVTLSKTNSDVTLSTTSLTFTPSEYATPQTVTITVAEDADLDNETDVVILTSPNVQTKQVDVYITDNDIQSNYNKYTVEYQGTSINISDTKLDPDENIYVTEITGYTENSTLLSCGVFNNDTSKYDIGIKSSSSGTDYSKVISLSNSLKKIDTTSDRFYWDNTKGHYCIEKNISNIVTLNGTEGYNKDVVNANYATYRIQDTKINSNEKPIVSADNSIVKIMSDKCNGVKKLDLTKVDKNICVGETASYALILHLYHTTIGHDSSGGINYNNEKASQWVTNNTPKVIYLITTQIIDIPEMNEKISLKCFENTVSITPSVTVGNMKVLVPFREKI